MVYVWSRYWRVRFDVFAGSEAAGLSLEAVPAAAFSAWSAEDDEFPLGELVWLEPQAAKDNTAVPVITRQDIFLKTGIDNMNNPLSL
ncbi:hypothetical protein GCM10010917_14010 [Paenibacillus physcomitrellae]|uniref:Uncharacterized protein n=1 Tax=Paenibacillus physcomitrellae TaxID=1619311 RepID=A0ABQ1FVF8_9BACL|nr:hypothetical protein GCM10010917_14010 [Paenibacillus physcomitrellae]